jgi:hypothetical protein
VSVFHNGKGTPIHRRRDALFKDGIAVERAERAQEADSARINAAVETAENAITALASRQLDPTEIRKEWAAIRDRTILALRDVRHNIIRRAAAAKETERWMVEKWLREVYDDKILHAFTADLQTKPTKHLVDYLGYLIQVVDLARIQSVNAVFAARADNQRYRAIFTKMLGQFTLSQSGIMGARLARICDLAESVDLKITNLISSHYISKRPCLSAPQPLLQLEAPTLGASHNELVSASSSQVTEVLSSPSS